MKLPSKLKFVCRFICESGTKGAASGGLSIGYKTQKTRTKYFREYYRTAAPIEIIIETERHFNFN
jgi:hypothetical protein